MQPLGAGIPPFCLACFGTDNRFSAQQVLQRWKYIYSGCAEKGISVVSYGGDGDSKVMKAMRVSALLLTPPNDPLLKDLSAPVSPIIIDPSWKNWFSAISPTMISYVQDVVHIAVKFKARLLNPAVKLKMGPSLEAEAYHLEQLHAKYGKEQHFLREKDLNHHDQQNFDAVLHIINACPLLKDIPGVYANKCFIE